MWHASAAPLRPNILGRKALRELALAALEGAGDAQLGEWEEYTGKAFHLRRRLTEAESALTGPAIDIRGTAEARQRINAMRIAQPNLPREIWMAEL